MVAQEQDLLTKKSNAASRDRLSRLFLLADQKLTLLEKRHLDGGPELSAADNEKDAKAMITLTNLYEKLVSMKDAKETMRSDEAERICLELAQRIKKLQRAREHKISKKPKRK